jgi:hypothetical protein
MVILPKRNQTNSFDENVKSRGLTPFGFVLYACSLDGLIS